WLCWPSWPNRLTSRLAHDQSISFPTRYNRVMSTLAIPAALALSLQCAPSVDPHMLVAIGQHESSLDPLTIHDNTTGQVLHGATVAAAASQLIAAGHSVDLGLMQINSKNLTLLSLSADEAFTACRSLETAARLLAL